MLRSLTLCILAFLFNFTPGVVPFAAASNDLSNYVASDGIVYADETIINLAFKGKRDFTIALLLTSESGKIDCQFCKVLGPNFRTMASSYQAQVSSEDRDLYFILADVQNTMPTFKTLGITHVPNLVFYPPTQSKGDAKLGLMAPHNFISFMSANDQIDYLGTVFSKQGFPINIVKPFPWSKLVKFLATLVSASVGGYLFRSQLIKIWRAKQIWLALSLMSVIMFTAGHMYNVTRGTPFMGYDGVGLTLVERSFNSQLAVETQIVATMYAVLSFTTIALIKFVPKLNTAKGQTIGALFAAFLLVFTYSALLELFKIKIGSFPLKLLPIKLF